MKFRLHNEQFYNIFYWKLNDVNMFDDLLITANTGVVLRRAAYELSYTLKKLRGFSPRANYTDRVTVACRRS
jgi:hypothetical protein